ncbi:MAG: Na+/H+ antiporter subunit E [Oscillospiraceae bacterium]|nr:Na+/H+ antiporter subunit E [Oscillospiraceae bacterium]
MFLILLILWFIFNGRFGWDVLAVGLVSCAAVDWFARKYCKWYITSDWRWLKFIPGILGYAALLVWEIIKANWAMIRIILSPKMKEEVQPQLVRFQVDYKSTLMRTLLANSITLTPGTITVRMLPDHFIVHALNPGMGVGLDESSFFKGCKRLDEFVCEPEDMEKEEAHVS